MDGTRVRNHSPHVALAATCLLPHPGPRRQLQDTPFKTQDCAGLDSSFMRPRGPCSRLAPALGSTKDVVPASCSPPAPSPPPSSQGFEPHRPPWLSGKNTASYPRPPLPAPDLRLQPLRPLSVPLTPCQASARPSLCPEPRPPCLLRSCPGILLRTTTQGASAPGLGPSPSRLLCKDHGSDVRV